MDMARKKWQSFAANTHKPPGKWLEPAFLL